MIKVTVESKKLITSEGSKAILKTVHHDFFFSSLKESTDFFKLPYTSVRNAKRKSGKIFPFSYNNYTFNKMEDGTI